MKLRILKTSHDAGVYVAALVERVLSEAERPVLGLATGSTALPLYEQLVQLHRSGLDFSKTTTVNLDEYIGLEANHPQSYYYFMQQHLFSHIQLAPHRVFIPNGMARDLEEECELYDAALQKYPIDLQILGIGVNGHIGFNEPNDLLLSKTHVVDLSPETIRSNARFFADVDSVPKQAITMGVQAILQARQIVLMAFGKEKAEIVAKAIQGAVRTDVPASILQLHRDVVFVLDEESASALG